jgi:YHS domain-containing protein
MGLMMSRLILFILLFLILYYVLHFLIRDMPSARKKINGKLKPEELVQDPYCLTYIPKGSAVKKKIDGKLFYFCNQECMKNYVKKITKNG